MGEKIAKRLFPVILVCLSLVISAGIRGQLLVTQQAQTAGDHKHSSISKEEITEGAQRALRNAFIENKGQLGNEEVAFYGFLANGKIGFCESKVLLYVGGMNELVMLQFEGSRRVVPIGVDELETKSNYFLGDRGTYTNVRSFGVVIYNELWPGIDLYYKTTSKGVKYEFHVVAGANPDDIKISCEGQEVLSIRKDSLVIQKDEGLFVDEGLKGLQEKREIDASFIAKGSDSFGFHVSDYDQNKLLIIDPLLYSTYIGGNNLDYGRAIAVDSSGNAYVTGWTQSHNFPIANAYNNTYNGGLGDCFVFKLATDGSSLLYSTFIGGSGQEWGCSIALDVEGSIYVSGWTASSDFPTTPNAFNNSYGGDEDCFVFKLTADGSSLLYSTYVGGSGDDWGWSIAVDSLGSAYVCGYTESRGFPTTENAYDNSYNDEYWFCECFVFKLATNGSTLLYSTFVGGGKNDYGWSLALDSKGNAYVTGWTQSSNFPTTANAYDDSYNGGEHGNDCFVFKLTADGSEICYSTFVGGSNNDYGYSIAVDSLGNSYVTGQTASYDFPTTANAYDNSSNGGKWGDCYVFKLDVTGSSLFYSTYVGGGDNESGSSISVDSEGNAYVTGWTDSRDFPTTANAYDESFNGGWNDCFVFKLVANGSSLLYSTFIGGSKTDLGQSIVVDGEGNTYVTGSTKSSDFPTKNAYDKSYNGDRDCFVFKLSTEDASSGVFGMSTVITISIVVISMTTIATIATVIQQRRKKSIEKLTCKRIIAKQLNEITVIL